LARVYLGGFQLPALNTLSNMSAAYLPGSSGPSAGVLLAVTGVVLVLVWTVRSPWRALAADEPEVTP
jgi:hypothetical protein